jgi:hypothetical protein
MGDILKRKVITEIYTFLILKHNLYLHILIECDLRQALILRIAVTILKHATQYIGIPRISTNLYFNENIIYALNNIDDKRILIYPHVAVLFAPYCNHNFALL